MADLSASLVPTRNRARAWLWGALGLVLLRAIPNLRFPLGRDQATYCLIGEGLLRGQQLYRDLWDNKPPAVFYFFALVVKLFGHVMWSVGILDILWLLAISYCIFRFTERYLGAPVAAVAALFNAAWHCTQGYIHAAQPETFVTLLVLAAYLLLLPERPRPYARHAMGGLILAAAFWFKYNALVFFPFVLVLPYLDLRSLEPGLRHFRLTIPRRAWLMRASLSMAGLAAGVGAVLGYFWLVGVWPALKEVQFEVLPRYGEMVFARTQHYWLIAVMQTYLHLGPWNEAIVAVALLLAWLRRDLAKAAPIILMALAGYLSTAAQGRFHPYYFETTFPFLAMFWGYTLVSAWEGFQFVRRYLGRRRWRLAQALLWLLCANLLYALLLQEGFRIVEQYRSFGRWRSNPNLSYAEYLWQIPLEKLHDQMAVINFLKKNSAPGDEVYVWGTAPLINFLSERRTPSRFVSNLALISPWGPARWQAELIGELEKACPRFIVVARHDMIPGVSYTRRDSEECLSNFPALAGLIRGRYRPVKNLTDFEIYQWAEGAATATGGEVPQWQR